MPGQDSNEGTTRATLTPSNMRPRPTGRTGHAQHEFLVDSGFLSSRRVGVVCTAVTGSGSPSCSTHLPTLLHRLSVLSTVPRASKHVPVALHHRGVVRNVLLGRLTHSHMPFLQVRRAPHRANVINCQQCANCVHGKGLSSCPLLHSL